MPSAFPLGMRYVTIAIMATLAGCGAVESSPAGTNATPVKSFDGVGPTTGGCPEHEPAAGEACSIPGRMCNWTRTCVDAGSPTATNTGWCTAAGKWRIVVHACTEGCPSERPTTMQSQFGPPANDHCTPGVQCTYPSTPLSSGVKCTCHATSDGRTVWPQVCEGWEDGWKPAPGPLPESQSCVELAPCAGSSGCGSMCTGGKSTRCGCGEDGKLYCTVSDC